MTAYLPQGTRCHTQADGRVSIAYTSDAPAEVIDALRRLEEGAPVDALLKVARRADTVSLWHVLWRIDARARRRGGRHPSGRLILERGENLCDSPHAMNARRHHHHHHPAGPVV